MLAISLMTAPTFAADGGKKKTRKKAKTECKMDKCCDPKDCTKDTKCPPMPVCKGS